MKVIIFPLFQEVTPPQGPDLENLQDMDDPANLSESAFSSVAWGLSYLCCQPPGGCHEDQKSVNHNKIIQRIPFINAHLGPGLVL